jgi:hypothetical protein
MALQLGAKSASGSVVSVEVSSTATSPKLVTVSLRVRVAGAFHDLTSEPTQIPGQGSAPVFLQAPGTVEYIVDSPEPAVMEWSE